MCGIAGILGDYQPEKFDAMVDSLRRRGPDGRGVFRAPGCLLGHTRLKIIDLSDNAAQPMESSCGRYVIVFNGEIYNFAELRRALPGPFRSQSDTEVLLACYIAWGENCLQRLNGMFAFAIWDKDQKSLFAARDRLGIKPFYYCRTARNFLFASEIKALLAAGVPRQPDYAAIHDFLRWGALDHGGSTWFQGIKALEPGCYLVADLTGTSCRRYWSLADEVEEDEPGREVVERFSSLLKESIAMQLVADRSIGSHLSGGVDSSVVTALARGMRPDLSTYTFGYREPEYDERPFAGEVAESLGLPNAASLLTPDDVETLFIPTLIAEDEPFTSFRQLSHHKLYADFKEGGSTVVLESSGGDEIGAGYTGFLWPWYLDLLERRGPLEARREFEAAAAALGIRGERLLTFTLSLAANDRQYGICTSDGTSFVAPQVLLPEFAKRHGTPFPSYRRPFRSALRNAQYIEMFHTKLPRGLRYVDRASADSGREARVPLLDHRIVALGFSAANDAKIKDGQLRWFMKEAVRQNLPAQLLRLNKRSVADPQRAWIRGPLLPLFEKLLSSRSFRERGVFDPAAARAQLEAFKSSPGMNSLGIFQFLITEMWFRLYIDGEGWRGLADGETLSGFNEAFQ